LLFEVGGGNSPRKFGSTHKPRRKTRGSLTKIKEIEHGTLRRACAIHKANLICTKELLKKGGTTFSRQTGGKRDRVYE